MLSSVFPRAHARYASLPLLGGDLDGLCIWLSAKGYPPDAVHRRVEAARLLESRLRARGVCALDDLTERELRAAAPQPTRWTAQLAGALARSLAEYLVACGRLASTRSTPSELELECYARHLSRVRGLAPRTVLKHTWAIREFLAFLGHDEDRARLCGIGIEALDEFIGTMGRRLGRVTMQTVTSSLRSYLRVESPRVFRGERLPRALSWDAVRAVLRAVDRSTRKGRRDYAMLLLVATYGLRASEVAALRLDDIAWRTRELRVPRPKAGASLSLPLTDDVATALLGYLRDGRPASAERAVFLRVRAPSGPIRASAVSDVFDVWCARAGIEVPAGRVGPYSMRHALAMHLLRQGAALKSIGDLLGHRTVESTSVYLRLHLDDLRDVALPLPRAAAAEVRS
jgi:integrase